MKYAIAVNDLGTEYVHRYVGKEPSGLRFNKLFLNEDGKNYIKVAWKKKYLTSLGNLCSYFLHFLKKSKSIHTFIFHRIL